MFGNGVAAEHAAEEHDFGDQEYPHAQRGRIPSAAPAVVEMMPQIRLRRRHVSESASASANGPPPLRRNTVRFSVTTGVTSKLNVGGGEGICSHSSPSLPTDSAAPWAFPYQSDQIR